MVDGKHVILCVHVHNRVENATKAQEVLTEYGCYIKTRIGLHEVNSDFCAPAGVMILELFGDADHCAGLKDKLNALPGIDTQEVVFTHE